MRKSSSLLNNHVNGIFLKKNSNSPVERRLNQPLLPVLVVAFAILYGLTAYRGWLVFLLGLAGLWLLAAFWALAMERGLSIERKIHLAWATVGESVHEQLKVINKSWLPAIWVEIVDASDTLEAPIRLVTDVGSHSTRTRRPSHLFKRRGLYSLGPTRLRAGDPFGIYTITLMNQHASSILVTPPLLPLKQIRISSGGWSGDDKRSRGAIERNISDAGVRDYIPGDSLRRIHWPASAHFNSLIVRQLDAAASRDWWIFVDLDKAVQVGTGQDSTLELSIVLAASLAARGLREHRRVGLALAGPKLIWLEPRSDPAHRWRILKALSMAEPGSHTVKELVELGKPVQTATVIFITPSPDPAWIASAVRRNRRGNIAALLVDPADFGSPLDQDRVIASLARSRIPYTSIPRQLLVEAYPSLRQGSKRISGGIEPGKRYLKQKSAAWQSMD